MRVRRTAALVGTLFALLAGATLSAAPASAGEGATILYPTECGYTPGHFPGIDVEIQATYCKVVITPAGVVNAVLKAQIPEGYPIPQGTTSDDNCRDTVSATGRINGTCHFGP